MDKNEVLKILETAKDKNGEVPMRLVRQAFEKLPEPCEDTISRRALCEYALNQKDKSVTPNDIMRFPSAQPKVIHCKDCEWWTKQDKSLQGCCELMQVYSTGGWFCGSAREKVKDESRVR